MFISHSIPCLLRSSRRSISTCTLIISHLLFQPLIHVRPILCLTNQQLSGPKNEVHRRTIVFTARSLTRVDYDRLDNNACTMVRKGLGVFKYTWYKTRSDERNVGKVEMKKLKLRFKSKISKISNYKKKTLFTILVLKTDHVS